MSPSLDTQQGLQSVVIRPSAPADRAALERLAGRDSQPVPAGRLLVAEAGGELLAAVPIAGGQPVADPFRPTAALIGLLELRAAQLRRAERDSPRGARFVGRAWVGRVAERLASG
jgi:hypothetical protein